MGMTDHLLLQLGLKQKLKLPIPVISVGNLTFGGTGKTPVIQFLLQRFLDQGKRPGLVSRAYKAKISQPEKIDLGHPSKSAEDYGDEPYMIAQKYPEVPVYVGAQKYECARAVFSQEAVDLILVDDGFQHSMLARDLDFVVIDSTKPLREYRYPPFGRARESWKALERAQAVILTKQNMINLNKDYQKIVEQIPSHVKVFSFDYRISTVQEINSGINQKFTDLRGQLTAFCGLGFPQAFYHQINESCSHLEVHPISFSDHHAYDLSDIQKILSTGSKEFLTTEKDAVKLKKIWPKDKTLWVTRLELLPKDPIESWNGFFAQYSL